MSIIVNPFVSSNETEKSRPKVFRANNALWKSGVKQGRIHASEIV